MEETKLTDEEIVKELINESNRGEWSNISFIDCVEVRILKNAIDLIRRLQKENEELRSPKFASWKLKFFNLKEEFDKELAEHKKFTQKAEAEIERLMSEIDQRREMMHRMDCNYATELQKNAELQKKVDELKEENNRYAEVFGMDGKDFYTVEVGEWEKVKSGVKDMIQQSVKNTAKKIFQGLESMANNGVYQGKLTVQQMSVFFKEQYGVEVEE